MYAISLPPRHLLVIFGEEFFFAKIFIMGKTKEIDWRKKEKKKVEGREERWGRG